MSALWISCFLLQGMLVSLPLKKKYFSYSSAEGVIAVIILCHVTINNIG